MPSFDNLHTQINSSIFNVGPVFVGLAAFGTYAALGRPLTAAVAFPSLALFILLLKQWSEARLSRLKADVDDE